MKTMNFKCLAVILALFVSVTGCKEKDEEEISKFVGNFVISKSVLAAVLTVPTVEAGDVNIPVNTDITQAIQTALLSAVSCSSADKSYVELRENFSMYFSCEGLNPLNAGTWEEVSASELKLNMNSTAIPPIGFVLTVTNIVENAGKLTGITSVPLPKDMVAAIVSSMQYTISPSAQDIFIISISIEFTKK